MKRIVIWIGGVVATGFLLLAAPGCGDARPASPAGSSDARKALDRALCAWREGKPVDSLKTEVPPMEAADHQWTGGLHLVKYEVDDNNRTSGDGQSFRVTLWLKDDHSKQTKVKTQYDVSTSPLRVVRAGF
jgi:hypothetical protein